MTHKIRVGAHVRLSLGLIESIKEVHKLGGNTVQFFVKSPKKRLISQKSGDEFEEAKKYLQKYDMMGIVHTSYMINTAQDFKPTKWWMKDLLGELQIAENMNCYACVLHLGKKLELGEQHAFNNMRQSVIYALEQIKKYKVKLLLETSSGQGSELGFKLLDFANFYKTIPEKYHKNLGVCIDTCHIFVAGYDIRTTEGAIAYLKEFDDLIGIKHIGLIHFNDSKVDLSSRVDRHDSIGKGKITEKGMDGLKVFFKYAVENSIPVILETPEMSFVREIPMLKNWASKYKK